MSENEADFSEENLEIASENEENPENMSDDDSFEKKNKDLIDKEEESEEEEGMNAWGNKKDKFYQSDEQSNSDLEDEEEQEALEIRKKNAEIMEEDDFYDEDVAKNDDNHVEQIKTTKNNEIVDITKLSEEEKLNFVVEDSPELLSLLKDYKKFLLELKNKIEPLKQIIVSKSTEYEISDKLKKFVCLKNDITTSYCMYILYYLSLKKSSQFSKNHPVFNKIINAKTMLKKLRPYEEKFSSEIANLLEKSKKNKMDTLKKSFKDTDSAKKSATKTIQPSPLKQKKNKKNKMQIEENIRKIYQEIDDPEEEKRIGISIGKKGKKDKKEEIPLRNVDLAVDDDDMELFSEDLDFDSSDLEDDHYKSVKKQKESEKRLKKQKKKIEKEQFFNEIKLTKVNEDEGRKISYEMLKNKGLTRKRKKVDRNSRVKLRQKFGKTMNKLKSKGIYLRKRDKVYQGELTGINAGLIKGVSLKHGK